MGHKKDNEIDKPHLIICEGIDAKYFLIWYLESLSPDSNEEDRVFQVMDAGGNSDIRRFMKTLPGLPNFSMVKSVTVIRDSEKNSQGASQSVRNILKDCNFAVPRQPCEIAFPSENEHKVKTGYALFPTLNLETENGTLEDLCLNTIANPDEKTLEIVNDAIAKIGPLTRPHKNKLFTYLSLTNNYVGLKIGESTKSKAFDLGARDLEPLKQLLAGMVGGGGVEG